MYPTAPTSRHGTPPPPPPRGSPQSSTVERPAALNSTFTESAARAALGSQGRPTQASSSGKTLPWHQRECVVWPKLVRRSRRRSGTSTAPCGASSPEVCVPKMAQINIPLVNFIFSHAEISVRGWGGRGSRGTPPPPPVVGVGRDAAPQKYSMEFLSSTPPDPRVPLASGRLQFAAPLRQCKDGDWRDTDVSWRPPDGGLRRTTSFSDGFGLFSMGQRSGGGGGGVYKGWLGTVYSVQCNVFCVTCCL